MAENENFRRDESGRGWRWLDDQQTWMPVEETNAAEAAWLGLGAFADQAGTAIKQMAGVDAPGEYQQMVEDRARFERDVGADQYWATAAGSHAPAAVVGAMTGGMAAPVIAGAAEGALMPAQDWGERVINMGVNTAMTGVGMGVGKMAGRVMSAIDQTAGGYGARMMGRGAGVADDVVGELQGIVKQGEDMGFKYLPGDRLQDAAVKAMDLGAMKKPLLKPYINEIVDTNNKVVSRAVGDALGVNPRLLDFADGRVTGEGLAEVRGELGGYFQRLGKIVPEIDIGKDFAKTIENVESFKKLKNLEPQLFQKMDQGIISGEEYQLVRAALGDFAKKEGGTIANSTGVKIDQLDDLVKGYLPKDELVRFARARERYGLLETIETGKALKSDGTFNTDTLANRIKSQIGQGNWHENNFTRIQPETAQLVKVLKHATDSRVRPLVGTSGTVEGMQGVEVLDAAMGMMRGDPAAIEKMAKEGLTAKTYKYLAENNPKALERLLNADTRELQRYGAQAGRGTAAEALQDWEGQAQ